MTRAVTSDSFWLKRNSAFCALLSLPRDIFPIMDLRLIGLVLSDFTKKQINWTLQERLFGFVSQYQIGLYE